jgi:hypothetical protein
LQFQSANEGNVAKIMEDAVTLLPALQVGLDVNVKFDNIYGFEYTNELEIFDLLDMKLVHGWLADPDDRQTYPFVANMSYNRAVEVSLGKIEPEKKADNQMEDKDSGNFASLKKEVSEPVDKDGHFLACQKFLQDNPTQLTFYGLGVLHQCLDDNSLNVFFRNNHFSVLYKRGGRLFLLVTDEAFLDLPQVVWEELSEVGGDTRYLDAEFRPIDFNAPQPRDSQPQRAQPQAASERRNKPENRSDPDDDCVIL